MDEEIRLAGGNMEPVHRRGDEVLRTAGPWTPAVHRLLRHCRAKGMTEVPEPKGMTEDGRERLSYLAGTVPLYPMPAWVWRDETMVAAARLLRRLHEATVDADRTGPWRGPIFDEDDFDTTAFTLCHNDFSPHNLVFDATGTSIGIIDFDYAAPGPRARELAYFAQRMVPLTTDRSDGHGDAERLRRLDALLAAYLDDPRPCAPITADEVLGWAVERLVDLATFSRRRAVELGKPALATDAELYDRDAVYVTALRSSGQ
ncbi:MAG TPA: aminoglycoside phosphotransferase family protein [Candidatus Luteococcus avicola]|nr:aminoglycoside phosphotransferase family protein [Candidatus Luteococcus avicola]